MLSGNLVKTITSDGLELKGFWMNQKSDIAVFHSHGTSGDFYTHEFIETEGEMLEKKGVSFLTANNRGHDVYADIKKHTRGKVEWTTVGGGFEKFEDCLLDIESWLEFLEKQGVKKVILQAHSLTQKILYYQWKKKDKRVIGQVHLSPQNDDGLMYYSLGPKKYKEINIKIRKMVKDGKGSNILPKEFSPVSYVTSAQMYHGYLTDYGTGTLTPYHNPKSSNWKVIAQAAEPMLVVFGSNDVYMKPSVETAVQLIKEKTNDTQNTQVTLIKGATHSYLGYEKQLVSTISKWLNKNFEL